MKFHQSHLTPRDISQRQRFVDDVPCCDDVQASGTDACDGGDDDPCPFAHFDASKFPQVPCYMPTPFNFFIVSRHFHGFKGKI